MTTLVIDELRNSLPLTQKINLVNELRSRVSAIRLHLMGFNNPTGDIKMAILRDDVEVDSVTQSLATIKASIDAALGVSEDYWHGMILFQLDETIVLERGQDIKIQLEDSTGYTFSESSYLGWVKEHENLKNTRFEDDPLNPFENPFTFELWKYKNEQDTRFF